MKQIYDMAVLGGGPAGYTAALYAARAGLKVLVLEKLSPGGQMALTHQVDNYPGFPQGIDGFALGEAMQQQAERFGSETLLADVTGLTLDGPIKQIETTEGLYQAKTLVIATGANPRELGLPGEKALVGRGVHYCAACDGMAYRNKTVLVVGGGNSAAADALALSRVAREVILVHRRDSLRATKIYHSSLAEAGNISFRWNSAVAELLQEDTFTGVILEDLTTGQRSRISCDGIFISIGRAPATELVQDQLKLDSGGYIPADESTRTELPGVFAAGDVRTKDLRQIITAAADGAMAAYWAEHYLAKN